MRNHTDKIWDIKPDIVGRKNYDFFETDNEKYGIYFSKVDEYGMNKFVSPVEIWTDKNNPRKIYESGKTKFEYQFKSSCYYFEKSDTIALLKPCLRKQKNYFDLPYILFDFVKAKFTIINYPNFNLKEINETCFQLELHFRYFYNEETKEKISKDNGAIIKLKQQDWFDFEKLNSVCDLFS